MLSVPVKTAPNASARPRRAAAARVRLDVESLAQGGDGVAHVETADGRRAVFVPGALPGDRIEADVDFGHRPARGRLLSVVAPSPDRRSPPCAEVGACGGCDWMHLDLGAQARWHARIVEAALGRAIGEVPKVVSHPAARSERYRTRARLAVRATGSRVLVGYHPPRSHAVHDVGGCIVLDERLARTIGDLRAVLARERGEGEAQIALGQGDRPVVDLRWTGELGGETFAAIDALVAAGAWGGADVRIGEARAPARIGDPTAQATGGDGGPLAVPSAGFAQAHPETSRALVARAVDLLAPDGDDVLELFSGSGNFTVALARRARSVVAVESDALAVAAARRNLESRGLAAKLVGADADAFDVPAKTRRILLDPPRAGADGACRRVAASRATRVVYASCDPGTLARDVATLAAAGFRLAVVETFEMFPHTSHVETLVALDRTRFARPHEAR
jgi:23S rRNA (uracil1939-C5)-methyltransferase